MCKAAPKFCRGNEEVDKKDDLEEDMHIGELGRQQAGGDGGEVVGRAEAGAEQQQPLGRRARGRAQGQ